MVITKMLFRRLISTLCLVIGTATLDVTIKELPDEIAQDVKHISKIQNEDILRCPLRPKADVQFFLYNRKQNETPVKFNPDKNNIEGKKLIILIHGWLSSYTSPELQDLKNAYLNKYDCNVLMVDWSKAALLPYKASYCRIGVISQTLSKLMCHLYKTQNINLKEVHIVAHSTGAHIAGFSGQFTFNKCKASVGRITALDPPNEQGIAKLTKTSAEFIEVIHTDAFGFGSSNNYGTSDYYPNCGTFQPGCTSKSTVSDDDLLSDVMCSHLRSIEYMTESISSMNAVAVSCTRCPRQCRPDIGTMRIYNLMGEDALPPVDKLFKTFLLRTNAAPPYFTGWDQL